MGNGGEGAARRAQGPGHGVGGPIGEQDERDVPGQSVECQRADGFLPHVAGVVGIDQPPPLVRRKLARGRNETGPARTRREVDRRNPAQHSRQKADGGEGVSDRQGMIVALFGEDGSDGGGRAVTPDEAGREASRRRVRRPRERAE